MWRLITEFRSWPRWGPTLRAVESSAVGVAAGVRGRVKTPAGVWLPFTITDVVEGRSWSWEVAGVSATGHVVEPLGPARCRAMFTVAWPFAPYVIVLRRGLKRLATLAETPT